MDEDIIIPPRVLQRANARCTWTALKGFEVSTPLAKFTATLTACDSSSVNKLLLKCLEVKHRGPPSVGPGHLIFPTWCLQHKVASIIEGLTEGLELTGPVYCTVQLLHSGETVSELAEHVCALLEDQLNFAPVDLADETDPQRHKSMLALLQASVAQRQPDEEREGSATTNRLMGDFIQFFGSDWTGPPQCRERLRERERERERERGGVGRVHV